MIDIDKNPESQLHIFEFLAEFKNPKNQRKRLKTTPFKTLQAIFQIIQTNINKKRSEHYPSKDLIADVAGICRKEVTEFITSEEIAIFCDVQRHYDTKRKRFESNRYKLKEWVFQWFRLFWRSGMMKHFRKRYDWWLSDFKKRINKWLVPLVQKGHSIKQIYESVVNNLSTEIRLKGAAAKGLKGAGIKPSGIHEAYGTKTNIEQSTNPLVKEILETVDLLGNRFSLRDGDIRWVTNYLNLNEIRGGITIQDQRLKNGMIPDSPIRAFMSAIKEYKKNKRVA
jgi:hypothetical protein